ncbi:DUF3618 domain-containing protein [Chelativorans sp. SCAU2101]|uniref:DUF3618 domain-containing protein n=1 Tax=Chelativorans petroleitrophicus TaxID=2975484 RepID=A0A9X3B6Q6_9HYPH|nr:DUF3618 domain-containing protein [Chelativorans petroleitrophicus]MCT8990833.1 DUF3618 domain-containing protein [Chelativorans petroleitrophicus]
MTEKTSAELEHEAESVRSRMTETAESLQRKLSPGQLVDEFTAYFRNSDGKIALDNLKAQVRDNPLPLAMISAGVAWLFMGGGPSARQYGWNGRDNGQDATAADTFGASGAEVWEGASGLEPLEGGAPYGDRNAQDSGASLTDRVGAAYSATGEAASSAASRVSGTARSVGRRAGEAGSSARRMLTDSLEQEPLILGALGVAVGAAVGAMMPRTKVEEAYLAPYGEKMRDSAKEAVDRGLEKTRSAASAVLKDETQSKSESRHTASERQQASALGSQSERNRTK